MDSNRRASSAIEADDIDSFQDVDTDNLHYRQARPYQRLRSQQSRQSHFSIESGPGLDYAGNSQNGSFYTGQPRMSSSFSPGTQRLASFDFSTSSSFQGVKSPETSLRSHSRDIESFHQQEEDDIRRGSYIDQQSFEQSVPVGYVGGEGFYDDNHDGMTQNDEYYSENPPEPHYFHPGLEHDDNNPPMMILEPIHENDPLILSNAQSKPIGESNYTTSSGEFSEHPDVEEVRMEQLLTESQKDNQRNNKKKKLLLLAFSLLFLGGMGYLIYWLAARAKLKPQENPVYVSPYGNDSAISSGGIDFTSISQLRSPPESFGAVCSRNNIVKNSSGIFECEAACRPSECCYQQGIERSNLNCAEESACLEYSPLCDFIYGALPAVNRSGDSNFENSTGSNATSITYPPEAPDNLLESCLEGDCLDLCYDGYCCFSSATNILLLNSTEMMPSCYDESMCMGYTPCLLGIIEQVNGLLGTNKGDQIGDVFSEPPNDLVETCSSESTSTQHGFVNCVSKCSAALCCRDNSCPGEDFVDKCLEYAVSCGRVLSVATPVSKDANMTVVPEAPRDLDQLCSTNETGVINNLTGCMQACQPSLCCTEGCLDDNVAACSGYASCQSLFEFIANSTTDNDKVPLSTGNLSEACESLESTDEIVRCYDLCRPAECCFDKFNSCLNDNIDSCAQYQDCQNLTTIIEAADEILLEALGLLKPPLENISTICSLDSLRTLAGKTECLSACDAGECCAENLDGCYSLLPEICVLDDDLCSNLTLEESILFPDPPDDIAEKCLSEENLDICVQLCSPALCCFAVDDALNCAEDHPSWCDSYESCADPTVGTENVASILQQFCHAVNTTEANFTECKKLCVEGSCCFQPVDSPFSCSNQTDFCKYYEPCGQLEIFNLSSTTNMSALDNACSNLDFAQIGSNNIDGSQIDECRELCTEAECCFVGGIDTCAYNEAFCLPYMPCEPLYNATSKEAFQSEPFDSTNNNSNGPSIDEERPVPRMPPNNISELCSLDSLRTVIGRQDCESVCSAGECCLGSGGCQSLYFEVCQMYTAPCAMLELEEDIIFPQPRENQSIFCDRSSDALEDCLSLCETASCCFAATEDLQCSVKEDTWCDTYSPCKAAVLGEKTTSVESNVSLSARGESSLLEMACRLESISTPNGMEACFSMCSEGRCCFDENDAVDNGGCEVDCNLFSPCESLQGKLSGSASTTEEERPSAAPISVPSSFLLSLPNTTGINGSIIAHPSFAPVFPPIISPVSFGNNESTGGHSVAPVLPAPVVAVSPTMPSPFAPQSTNESTTALIEACSPASLTSESGLLECQYQCRYGICCLRGNASSNSSSDCSEEFCEYYSPCLNLFDLFPVGAPTPSAPSPISPSWRAEHPSAPTWYWSPSHPITPSWYYSPSHPVYPTSSSNESDIPTALLALNESLG